MKNRTKVMLSTAVVGALGCVVALGVFGLFSSTTQNNGNEITTGTVALTDNDAGQAMFNVNGAKPGDTWSRCIKVSYNGTLPADVHTYISTSAGALQPYVNLKVEQGTQTAATFPSCNGFTPDSSGAGIDVPLGTGAASIGTYETGRSVKPAGQTVWNPGDSLVFRVTMTLSPNAPDNVQGQSTGTQTVYYEARDS